MSLGSGLVVCVCVGGSARMLHALVGCGSSPSALSSGLPVRGHVHAAPAPRAGRAEAPACARGRQLVQPSLSKILAVYFAVAVTGAITDVVELMLGRLF